MDNRVSRVSRLIQSLCRTYNDLPRHEPRLQRPLPGDLCPPRPHAAGHAPRPAPRRWAGGGAEAAHAAGLQHGGRREAGTPEAGARHRVEPWGDTGACTSPEQTHKVTDLPDFTLILLLRCLCLPGDRWLSVT